MPVADQDVERIVQTVLERLRVAGIDLHPAAEAVSDVKSSNQRNNHQLELQQPVISLAAVQGRLEGVERLVVGRKAVVTPAVKDELNRRRISLQRGGREPKASAPDEPVCIVNTVHHAETSALKQSLSSAGLAARWPAGGSLQEAVAQLRDQLGGDGRLGVLLSDRPVVALCLANRNPELRAAAVTSAADAEVACSLLDANVVIADPTSLAPREITQILQAFVQSDSRTRPAELAH